MSIFFFTACILCVLYCVLYGVYSIADKNISQAMSIFTMSALAAGAVVVLAIVA
ncbi:MAG: hypothetical protein IKU32_03470 [Clostridia bacterium]|nr:hypothetical protein [Clostridia bacterium]